MTTPALKYLLELVTEKPQEVVIDSEYRPHITPQLAAEVLDLFEAAYEEGDTDVVERVGRVGVLVNSILGRRHVATIFQLNTARLSYVQARTISDYERVREEALRLMNLAESSAFADIEFAASLLAADCAAMASEHDRRQWLLPALEDSVRTAELAKQAVALEWFDEFMLTTSVVAYKAMSVILETGSMVTSVLWDNEVASKVPGLLRRLTQSLEAVVSLEYMQPDGPQSAMRVTNTLADLSFKYGSRSIAERRLDFTINALRAHGAEDAASEGIKLREHWSRKLG
jgi:hypothetical protein